MGSNTEQNVKREFVQKGGTHRQWIYSHKTAIERSSKENEKSWTRMPPVLPAKNKGKKPWKSNQKKPQLSCN